MPDQDRPPDLPRRAAPTWLKWTAIGCGAVLLLVVILASALYFWWQRNQERIMEGADAVADTAAVFARTSNQQGCMAEGMRRAEGGGGFAVALRNRIFVRACLENAATVAGLCTDVPPQGRVMETARWQRDECGDNQPCLQALSALQEHCARGAPATADSPP